MDLLRPDSVLVTRSEVRRNHWSLPACLCISHNTMSSLTDLRIMFCRSATNNKHQSNLVKGGIADRSCHLVNRKSFCHKSESIAFSAMGLTTGGPGKTFLRGPSDKNFFEFCFFKMAHSGVLYIFERRRDPKSRGARKKLPPFPSLSKSLRVSQGHPSNTTRHWTSQGIIHGTDC